MSGWINVPELETAILPLAGKETPCYWDKILIPLHKEAVLEFL
jgi:hypothetical protein